MYTTRGYRVTLSFPEGRAIRFLWPLTLCPRILHTFLTPLANVMRSWERNGGKHHAVLATPKARSDPPTNSRDYPENPPDLPFLRPRGISALVHIE